MNTAVSLIHTCMDCQNVHIAHYVTEFPKTVCFQFQTKYVRLERCAKIDSEFFVNTTHHIDSCPHSIPYLHVVQSSQGR